MYIRPLRTFALGSFPLPKTNDAHRGAAAKEAQTNPAPTSSPPATKAFRRLAHEQTLNEDKIDGGLTKLGCVLTHVGNETRQHAPYGEIKLADSLPPPILGTFTQIIAKRSGEALRPLTNRDLVCRKRYMLKGHSSKKGSEIDKRD